MKEVVLSETHGLVSIEERYEKIHGIEILGPDDIVIADLDPIPVIAHKMINNVIQNRVKEDES